MVESYSFESTASRPPRAESDSDFKVFCERLELSEDHRQEIKNQLDDFIVHHHANIKWYDDAIRRELRLRRAYFIISMGLLVVIPAGIFVITSDKLLGDAIDPNMTVVLAAGLSGLFAFHRGATAWLDKRQLVALYAKTRAQLKTAVYSFERAWKTSRRGAKTIAELAIALEDATAAAIAAVAAEQAACYDIEAAPTFGLSDMLNSASSAAGQLTSALAAKESQEDKDRRELERGIRELAARADRLTALITAARAELGRNSDDRTKVEQINSLVAKRQSTELEQAIAVAKLKGLRRA